MSKLPSQKEYNRIKNHYQSLARDQEKKLGSDLVALRNDLVPKYLKGKFLTGCAIFGTTYMLEEIAFRKKVPGIVKFVGALATTVVAPKIYRMVYQNYFEVKSDSPLNQPLPPSEPVPDTDTEPIPEV